jgi:hypothetical protein
MPQPQVSIQDGYAQQHLGRLWYNKNQYTEVRYFGTTTAVGPTELFIDGIAGNRLKIPENSVVTIYGVGAGFQTTGTPAGFGSTIFASAMNLNGTVTAMANATVDVAPDANTTHLPSIVADSTNDSLNLQVTSVAQTVYHEFVVRIVCATDPESNFGQLT